MSEMTLERIAELTAGITSGEYSIGATSGGPSLSEYHDLLALARRALEQVIATREQAAYQRGRQEAQSPAPTGAVTPAHRAAAVELLTREYGKGHPADPGRAFTVCFRTTSYHHQEEELSQLLATREAAAYQRGRQETQDVNNGSVTPRERLLAEMGLDWTWYRPEVLLDEVDEDPPQALEQPAPTGEVTREHREAVVWAYTRDEPLIWERRWMHTGDIDQYYETQTLRLAAIAQLLATREAAAYERGRQEAQGGWVAPPELHGAAGYLRAELLQYGWGIRPRVARALELLETLLPPPPSDTGKGGGK